MPKVNDMRTEDVTIEPEDGEVRVDDFRCSEKNLAFNSKNEREERVTYFSKSGVVIAEVRRDHVTTSCYGPAATGGLYWHLVKKSQFKSSGVIQMFY